jgi:hypothetical protein
LARTILIVTSALIAGLTFAFSFGNVWTLDLMLGVEKHIAPLVGPAVDLSVIGLLITVQWLSLAGVTSRALRPARRLLNACGLVTMALNSAPSLVAGHATGDATAYGRAAVEAIAPWLLISWSHVGPLMLRHFVELRTAQLVTVQTAPIEVSAEPVQTVQSEPLDQSEDQSDPPAQTADRSPVHRSKTKRTAPADRKLHVVQTARMSVEERVAVLVQTYPDRIPTYTEAMADLDWTSRGYAAEAIKELRRRREQTTAPADDSDRGDEDHPAELDVAGAAVGGTP